MSWAQTFLSNCCPSNLVPRSFTSCSQKVGAQLKIPILRLCPSHAQFVPRLGPSCTQAVPGSTKNTASGTTNNGRKDNITTSGTKNDMRWLKLPPPQLKRTWDEWKYRLRNYQWQGKTENTVSGNINDRRLQDAAAYIQYNIHNYLCMMVLTLFLEDCTYIQQRNTVGLLGTITLQKMVDCSQIQ